MRRTWALPPFLALAITGCATVPAASASPQASLVAGPIIAERAVGPPCPDDWICLDWIYDFRIDATTLSGRRVPSPITARMTVHGPPRSEYQIVLLVRREGRGQPWSGTPLTLARPGEEACVGKAVLGDAGLRPPPNAYRRGDEVCFIL
jgi:hypothetical protein